MNNRDALEQATVRIDRMIWLPNEMANFDATSPVFREFCENMPDREDAPLFASLPCLSRFAGAEIEPDEEAVTEALFFGNVTEGFMFQAAHPVKEWHSQKTSSYSWGFYNTAWLYALTLEGVVTAAVAWAEKLDEAAKARALSRA